MKVIRNMPYDMMMTHRLALDGLSDRTRGSLVSLLATAGALER